MVAELVFYLNVCICGLSSYGRVSRVLGLPVCRSSRRLAVCRNSVSVMFGGTKFGGAKFDRQTRTKSKHTVDRIYLQH